ncbi:nuclear transport factor 2-like isoform X1 [Zingiber officinale]|nr:nuclear transport factor 2-like isoform X1 [Zingiber officinale]
MAAQPTGVERSPLPAEVVGNAFVDQYYHILQHSPDMLHRFYQESSKLGRLDSHGAMVLVTTTEAINQKLLLSTGHVGAEMKTVDAQESLGDGVSVLVTGYLTGEDNVKRSFIQSFFLAPQDNGFFVLNDIFRFVEEAEHQQVNQGLANGNAEPHAAEEALPPQQEEQALDQTVSVEDEVLNKEEVYKPSENGLVVEEEEPIAKVINEVPSVSPVVVVESSPVTAQEDMPKKSYASIVKIMKDSTAVSVPARIPHRQPTVKAEPVPVPAPSAVPTTDAPTTNSSTAERSNVIEAEGADGHSIFVKSLPLDATPEQLEQEFNKFGPIKADGIQVRSHKLQGFCYGFVEFEAANSVQKALEASPVMIGGRQAYVEEKRATGSRVGSRGRFDARGGFRNDARGRGSFYGGGRGYGRRDFDTKPDFGGRGGGRGRYPNRGDVGYQRVDGMDFVGGRGNSSAGSAIRASARN